MMNGTRVDKRCSLWVSDRYGRAGCLGTGVTASTGPSFIALSGRHPAAPLRYVDVPLAYAAGWVAGAVAGSGFGFSRSSAGSSQLSRSSTSIPSP